MSLTTTLSVVILVLNWKNWQRTLECLASLDKLDYPNFEILVVDNDSEDGSQARIEAARPDVKVIQTGVNLGYAGGNNVGIRYVLERGTDYVWILNNDTLVEPDTLTRLVKAARSRSKVGIVGVMSVEQTEDGAREVETSAHWWRGERPIPVLCVDSTGHAGEQMRLVDVVAGTSVFLDTTMLREVGTFDERFFHYYEDVELCERARRAGWEVGYVCSARIWHSVGGSLSNFSMQARYYYVRNWFLFLQWSGRSSLKGLFWRDPVLLIARVFGVVWLLKGRWRVAAAGMVGALDAVRGRHGKRDLQRWPFAPKQSASLLARCLHVFRKRKG